MLSSARIICERGEGCAHGVVLDRRTEVACDVLSPHRTVRNAPACAGVGSSKHGRRQGAAITAPAGGVRILLARANSQQCIQYMKFKKYPKGDQRFDSTRYNASIHVGKGPAQLATSGRYSQVDTVIRLPRHIYGRDNA